MIFFDQSGRRWRVLKRSGLIGTSLVSIPLLFLGIGSTAYHPSWPKISLGPLEQIQDKIEESIDKVFQLDTPEADDGQHVAIQPNADFKTPAVAGVTINTIGELTNILPKSEPLSSKLTVSVDEDTGENESKGNQSTKSNLTNQFKPDVIPLQENTPIPPSESVASVDDPPGNSEVGQAHNEQPNPPENNQNNKEPTGTESNDPTPTEETESDPAPEEPEPGNSDFGKAEHTSGPPEHSNKGGKIK